jgi:hypothetical protein
MKRTTLSLLALLSWPVLAQPAPAPAPAPAEGAPAPPPTDGAATTATPKGSGQKKAKPVAPEAPKPDEKPADKK